MPEPLRAALNRNGSRTASRPSSADTSAGPVRNAVRSSRQRPKTHLTSWSLRSAICVWLASSIKCAISDWGIENVTDNVDSGGGNAERGGESAGRGALTPHPSRRSGRIKERHRKGRLMPSSSSSQRPPATSGSETDQDWLASAPLGVKNSKLVLQPRPILAAFRQDYRFERSRDDETLYSLLIHATRGCSGSVCRRSS